LVEQIKALDPEASIIWGSVSRLEKQLEELENENRTIRPHLQGIF
jgi:ABC-type Fe3+-hydroxamate transport system substrate-binding protein